jgi:hypothetical protein
VTRKRGSQSDPSIDELADEAARHNPDPVTRREALVEAEGEVERRSESAPRTDAIRREERQVKRRYGESPDNP